jgi:hypothetical protein
MGLEKIQYTPLPDLNFCERRPKFIHVIFHDGSFFMNHYGSDVKQMIEVYNLPPDKEFIPCVDHDGVYWIGTEPDSYQVGYGVQVQLTQQELVQDLSDAGVRFYKAVKSRQF